MKKLLVAPVPEPAPPDDLPDFPEDVARLVAVAAKAGYDVSQEVAAHLWALHSADLCAGWLSANWNDESVLESLLKHAVVTDIAAVVPTLPAGYGTWLDYAVDTVKLPASEVARLAAVVTHYSMGGPPAQWPPAEGLPPAGTGRHLAVAGWERGTSHRAATTGVP